MKATTCVRVVLPTDELVRMECAATMTVADLAKVLAKRSSFQQTKEIERTRGGDFVSCGDNNYDADPATELSLDCSNGSVSHASRGKLTLVRMESELKAASLVIDEVEELDILEFKLASSESSNWIPEINFRQSRRISPIIKPHQGVQPVSTALIPLWDVKQDRAAREEETTRQNSLELLTPAVPDHHPEVRLKGLIHNSNVRRSALRRRGARRHPSRNKRKVLVFSGFQERRRYTKMRKYAERILLQAGMQLIDCIQLVQKDVRELVFLLRDAILGGSSLRTDELLSLARTMVNVLTRTGADPSAGTPLISEDTREKLVRRLSWDVAGRDGGVAIILEGWIVTADWGTFWRSQRKEYACLCDNHILYFFSSRTHCADFVFELGRERDGTVSEASKRFLKDNSPLSQIDLSETSWTVRKSIQEEDSGKYHRNAIAFFDLNGRMRLVLDVSTAADATMWARQISAEISQNKLFARMRELNGEAPEKAEPEKPEEYTDNSNPLATWMEITTQSSTIVGDQQSITIPLRSLYSQIDRMDGRARAERYKSWTLNQALKDLQRDRVKINGLPLAGASLEANILALTLEILRCTEPKRENNSAESSSESVTAREMTALRFARQVPSTEAPLSAHIMMKMTYRVIPTDAIGPMDDQTYTNGTDASATDNNAQSGEADQNQTTEFKILGTYSRRLNCHFAEVNDIEGSVQLQFAG